MYGKQYRKEAMNQPTKQYTKIKAKRLRATTFALTKWGAIEKVQYCYCNIGRKKRVQNFFSHFDGSNNINMYLKNCCLSRS